MLTVTPLLKEIAEEGKYTFISTGMSTLDEIDTAVQIFTDAGCPFELMHCVSAYPLDNSTANLNMINTLRDRYNVNVGYSGHEKGLQISLAAVANKYGARILRRPTRLATDKSTSESALLHFAEEVDFEHVVFIQPTSPLLKSEYIDSGIAMIGEYDSIFSAYVQHWTPRWTKTLPSEPIGWEPDNRPPRS